MNLMRTVLNQKLCLNICVGEIGDMLTSAVKALESPSGKKPVFSKDQYTACFFDIQRNGKIALHCTV